MKKFFTQKAFLLFTLFFVLIAICSFAAFHETEQVCSGTQCCLQMTPPAKSGEMLWELVSRQLIGIFSI